MILKVKSKRVVSKSGIPGIDYVINHYVGCLHGCKYCYAKFYTKVKKKWGNWVIAKENTPELLKNKLFNGKILISSLSDPYQPVEREFKLTRRILEALNKRNEISILTKSDLVLRDIDLFKEFERIEVGITVNYFDEEIRKEIEPRAPSFEKRIDALKKLKDEGINNYAFISPVIPELTDVEGLIKEIRSFVDKIYLETLNIRKCGKEFLSWLVENFPKSYEILKNKKLLRNFVKKFSVDILILH